MKVLFRKNKKNVVQKKSKSTKKLRSKHMHSLCRRAKEGKNRLPTSWKKLNFRTTTQQRIVHLSRSPCTRHTQTGTHSWVPGPRWCTSPRPWDTWCTVSRFGRCWGYGPRRCCRTCLCRSWPPPPPPPPLPGVLPSPSSWCPLGPMGRGPGRRRYIGSPTAGVASPVGQGTPQGSVRLWTDIELP